MTQNDFITKVNELGLEVTDEKLDKPGHSSRTGKKYA